MRNRCQPTGSMLAFRVAPLEASTKIAYFDLNVKVYFTVDVQVLR